MVIQITVPSALGIFFTHRYFSRLLIVSGTVIMMAIALLCQLFQHRAVNARILASMGGLYVTFALSAAINAP